MMIEYCGFKDIFIGLYKDDDDDGRYYIIYGKTNNVTIKTEEESQNINFLPSGRLNYCFSKNKKMSIEIPFINNNNNNNDNRLCTIINIYNKSEYYTIVEILKRLLI